MNAWIFRIVLLLAACAASPGAAAEPARCGPDLAGSPCGGEQVAGMDGTGGVPQGVGNPVNLITGNKHQRETDMAALPGTLGLELVRHYNSQLAGPGMPLHGIGRGWQLSYDTRLFAEGRSLQIVQADGARLIFARSAWSATLCSSQDPAQGVVLVGPDQDPIRYRWLWPNGRELGFDRHGRLRRIAVPSGEALVIERLADGRIAKVTDPQGRSLRFHYLKKGQHRPGRLSAIQSVDTPVGRFFYDYGDSAPDASPQQAQNLLAVHLPTRHEPGVLRSLDGRGDRPSDYSRSTVQRRYHYEDARFPALLTGISVTGAGSDERAVDRRIATWAYDGNGLAVRSAAGAQQITLQRREPGRTRLTDGDGRVTTYRHAIVGGAFRLLEARGAGCERCGPVNVRYGYDALGRLQEVTRLDARGLPIDGRREERDALGRAYASKTVQYANGRETGRTLVLRQLYPPIGMAYTRPDARLPRSHYGPKQVAMRSVVAGRDHKTVIQYNQRQQPLTVSETGYNPVDGSQAVRITRYRYEEIAGRSLLVETDGPLPNGPAGTPADSDITRYEWDARGAFVRKISHPMGAVSELDYDPHSGRLAVMTVRWAQAVRQVRYEYAPSGQVERIQERALDGDGVTVLGERTMRLRHDALGRPSQLTAPDGSVRDLGRGASAGLPAPPVLPSAGVLPMGSALMPSQYGDPATAAAREALRFDANGAFAERRLDDFGQVVAIRNPGQGWHYARYDQAGRIVEIRDARGALTRAAYDAAGRLLQIDRTLAGSAPERLDFAWRGPDRHSETVTIAGRQTHATHYRHTPWGQSYSRQGWSEPLSR